MSSISNSTPVVTATEAEVLSTLTSERKPTYIHEQHNSNCQQFFGPLYGCVFAMPGSSVTPPVVNPVDKTNPSVLTPKPSPKPKAPTAKVRTAKKKAGTITTRELMTFSKGTIIDGHLKILCLDLMKDGWIEAGTNEVDFLDLFSGVRSECYIVWTGKYGKGTLVYLFCQLYAEGLIEIANGYTLAHILEGHFKDKSGKFLTNLDHGDPYNEQVVPMVQDYISKIKNSLSHMRHRDDDYDDNHGVNSRFDYSDRSSLRVRSHLSR